MTRVLAACFALILAPPLSSAPKPKEATPVYLPITVGDRWVMVMQFGGQTFEHREVVSKVETKGGATHVSITREGPGDPIPDLFRFKVTEKGVFLEGIGGTAYDPPFCPLRLPVAAGDEWTEEVAAQPGVRVASTTKYKTVGPEEVEVPAGKFKAVRVDSVRTTKDYTATTSIWFAPGVGIVKDVSKTGTNETVRLLKSFTPAKK
jgi:hypothetical protein